MVTAEKHMRGLMTRRSPTRTSGWEQEIERTFGDFFGRTLRPFLDEHRRTPFNFGVSPPAVDLYEENNEVVAKAELPGMEKDDIQINIRNRQLSIKGEKKRAQEVEEEDYYLCERSCGSFLRILDLPGEVQVEKARTTFKNGVLEIRLPRTEQAKKREIKVKVE